MRVCDMEGGMNETKLKDTHFLTIVVMYCFDVSLLFLFFCFEICELTCCFIEVNPLQ